ncbi:WW domain-binding protein 11-like [Equus przewalskii]|uniref:WW domain-binding protein 11-like n=1 Tax=Equus przewalskii TaxID=9798 RepID=A0ABM4LZN3_EQUPR
MEQSIAIAISRETWESRISALRLYHSDTERAATAQQRAQTPVAAPSGRQGAPVLAVTDPPAPPAQRDPPGAPAADTGRPGASPSAGARPGRGAAGLRDRAGRDNAEQTLPFGPTRRGAPPGPRQSLPLPAPARVHPSLSPGRSGPHRFQERALIRGPAARGQSVLWAVSRLRRLSGEKDTNSGKRRRSYNLDSRDGILRPPPVE